MIKNKFCIVGIDRDFEEFIIENKGEEVISEKHDKDFDKKKETMVESEPTEKKEEKEEEKDFADVDFENDDE